MRLMPSGWTVGGQMLCKYQYPIGLATSLGMLLWIGKITRPCDHIYQTIVAHTGVLDQLCFQDPFCLYLN